MKGKKPEPKIISDYGITNSNEIYAQTMSQSKLWYISFFFLSLSEGKHQALETEFG